MATSDESSWASQIEGAAKCTIGDIAKVRVGIKTTADRVFIRSDWGALPEALRPEPRILRPIFTHHDAGRWKATTPATSLVRILYPHESVDGKRRPIDLARFPGAANYLESQREILERRTYVTAGGRKWYEIWVTQDPAMWNKPKIVFPDISVGPRLFFDDSGVLVNGDCYWIALDSVQTDLLYLIQGVANSSVLTRYHDLAFNNRLYSGRRRYISQYIERYPMPDPDSAAARNVIRLVKRLIQRPSDRLESELNRAVAISFGVDGSL
jgi:hypothetical protein